MSTSGLLSTRDMGRLDRGLQSARKMLMGLGYLFYEERLRAGTVQSAEGKAQVSLINAYKYLEGGCKEARASLL